MQNVQFTLTGISPILLHNGQTADPLNAYAKAMKSLNSKRGKTDDDQVAISHLEWFAGIYHDGAEDQIDDGGKVKVSSSAKVIVPAINLEAALKAGAKKSKLGKSIEAGCFIENDAHLIYEGPTDINQLHADGRFINRSAVKIGQVKIMRTRPIFRKWSLNLTVSIDETVIEVRQVFKAWQDTGRLVGLGDWKPRFGRFEVQKN